MANRRVNHKVHALLLALAVLLSIFITCNDNWDGMDRSGWDWKGNQARTEGMR